MRKKVTGALGNVEWEVVAGGKRMLPQGERVTTTSTTIELQSYHKPGLRALSLIISMWSRWFVQYHHHQQQ